MMVKGLMGSMQTSVCVCVWYVSARRHPCTTLYTDDALLQIGLIVNV